jgi:hypothetical protein
MKKPYDVYLYKTFSGRVVAGRFMSDCLPEGWFDSPEKALQLNENNEIVKTPKKKLGRPKKVVVNERFTDFTASL